MDSACCYPVSESFKFPRSPDSLLSYSSCFRRPGRYNPEAWPLSLSLLQMEQAICQVLTPSPARFVLRGVCRFCPSTHPDSPKTSQAASPAQPDTPYGPFETQPQFTGRDRRTATGHRGPRYTSGSSHGRSLEDNRANCECKGLTARRMLVVCRTLVRATEGLQRQRVSLQTRTWK